MKKFYVLFVLSFVSLFLLAGCGPKEIPKSNEGEYEEVSQPFTDLEEMAVEINESGGVAAVGEGVSTRQDLAKDKARNEALGKLSEIFSQKVSRMTKSFSEEVGSGTQPEINEVFTRATKNVASATLQGAITKKSKLTQNSKTKQYMAGVLVVITPKTVNNSIFDEIRNTDKRMYERFRASQTFDELNKEAEEFEKKQQGNN